MTSGVRRHRVRSRLRCRMVSCPAAKQIRWVKPSIATVSPSRTRSATASRIVVTLELIRRPAVVRPAQDAELVPFGIAHLRPERPALLDEAPDRRAERRDAVDLLGPRAAGSDVEVDPVLDRLRLRDAHERQHRIFVATHDLDTVLAGLELAIPESSGPEVGDASPVAGIDDHGIEAPCVALPALAVRAQDAELVALRVAHHGPRTVTLGDVSDLCGPEIAETGDLLRHRRGRPQVEVD